MPKSIHEVVESPPSLDEVIGQRRAVEQVRVALQSHKVDAAEGAASAFGHTLLVGPAGVGKTLLSKIVAQELGATLFEDLAQNLATPGSLRGLLLLAEAGDVILIDEVHELPQVCQTTLYRALEEGKLFLPSSGGERSMTLPPFTFIGATTDEWALTAPLRQRFRLTLRLEHYGEGDLAAVLGQRAQRLGWRITDAALSAIAARSRGTPRIAIRLLESTRRTARAEGADRISLNHVRRTCEIEGIDVLGLDPLEQQYLRVLADANDAVRLNVLATRLGLPTRTTERVIESDLIRFGLVTKTESGRELTVAGRQHVSRTSVRTEGGEE